MVQLGGEVCETGAYFSSTQSNTAIQTDNAITSNGLITSCCIYCSDACQVKIKIFRDDGTNYDYIGELGSFSCADGINTFSGLSLVVQSGDKIGLYYTTTDGHPDGGSESGCDIYQRSGDITSDSAKSLWSLYASNRTFKVTVSGTVYTGDKYVDISTGSDSDDGNTWGNAYLTVKKGVDNVTAGKILHIAEGDYSAQAAIDLNKNLELLCEDYGGGNASPPLTVVLPVTT